MFGNLYTQKHVVMRIRLPFSKTFSIKNDSDNFILLQFLENKSSKKQFSLIGKLIIFQKSSIMGTEFLLLH